MTQSIFKRLKKGGERRERIKTQLGARKSRVAARAPRASKMRTSRSRALPKLMNVKLAANYTNPVTLEALLKGKAYQVKNRGTGRTNYYNRATLFSLLPSGIKNNYNLLMAFPKTALFRNPMTRGNVYPRNIIPVKII
jgi:hypothetical protein